MPEPDEYAPEGGLYPEYATDAAIEGYKVGAYYGQDIYKAGTLTAGEWRDIDALADWLEKFEAEEWNEYARKRGLYAFNVFEVRVKNGGDAIYNAKAELYGSDGKTLIYTALTDVTGRACLVYPEKYAGQVGVIKCCGKELQVTSADNGKTFELEADVASAAVTELDLMLMVDTTGSMGDELEYLKAELRDVVSRIAANGDQLSIRVSVNFYRDEGDEYIVKYFDFRTDIDECLEQIRKQYSDGGGDYPEAVHTALENAVNGHSWRENAVKLCFLVLDAPPHEEYEIQGINSQITKTLTDAASLGVRVIPVASSGVDKDTECLLRSYAVMTGGTYIFLTNHSGVGGDHIEASVGEYDVEPLNECMIRVACEYCGVKYEKIYEYDPGAVSGDPNDEQSVKIDPAVFRNGPAEGDKYLVNVIRRDPEAITSVANPGQTLGLERVAEIYGEYNSAFFTDNGIDSSRALYVSRYTSLIMVYLTREEIISAAKGDDVVSISPYDESEVLPE